MKRIVAWLWACVVYMSALAQNNSAEDYLFPEKYLVQVSTQKTISLVFPSAIRYVDVGTNEVLVKQVKEAENLLLVKAALENFRSTNISVITADGSIYPIEVEYATSPVQTIYFFDLRESLRRISFSGEKMRVSNLESVCIGLLDNGRRARGMRDSEWDMVAKVQGIYVQDKVLFFHLGLKNFSSIGYEVDFIRFFIKDRKGGKRTVVQEIELPVLFTAGNVRYVEASSNVQMVFALEKFTIPDAKDFIIQIGERKGGRHLQISVRNSKLFQAKILPVHY